MGAFNAGEARIASAQLRTLKLNEDPSVWEEVKERLTFSGATPGRSFQTRSFVDRMYRQSKSRADSAGTPKDPSDESGSFRLNASCMNMDFKLDQDYLACMRADPIADFLRRSFNEYLKCSPSQECAFAQIQSTGYCCRESS